MKKYIIMLIIALGAMVSLSGCGSYAGILYPYSDSQPFGYRCGRISDTGTRVTSYSWEWLDLGVYQRGMIVEVVKGDKIIRRYDLRIPRQEISENFNATNEFGEAVSVRIGINGYNSVNVVYCYCGRQEEHWFLS